MIFLIALTLLKLVGFLLLSIAIFYLPGHLLIQKKSKQISSFEDLFLSFCIGIVLLITFSVIFGITKLRFLVLPTIIILGIFSLYKGALGGLKKCFQAILGNKPLLAIIIIGILVQGFINFPSGMKYKEGIYFWSSQGHDGLWHVSLMKEMKNHFPLNNPLYAGRPVQNYHYSCDLLMGEFYRLFPFFDPLDLYFRFFPVIFSSLIGLGVFSFTKKKWNMTCAYWAMFFTYFCGSFGYIYSVMKGGFLFAGEAVFWAAQGNTILGNPPHALGLILLTASVLLLQIWSEEKKTFWLIVLGFLGFFLTTVKISSGVILLISLGVAGLFYLVTEKRLSILILSAVLGITNFVSLKMISPSAESFIMFLPLWFPRTMMVDKLSDVSWELKKQHYISKNTWHSWLRVYQLEIEAILIFIVGNSGMRILGFLEVIKRIKKIGVVDIFLFSCLVFPLVLVLLFVQKGIIYNFIQFMQIYLHFLGIFAGVSVAFLLGKIKNIKVKIILAVVIIFLAVPTAVGNLFDFYGRGARPNAKVTYPELSALDWLRKNSRPKDIVLTKPFYKRTGKEEYRYPTRPWPISAWYSTPYVYVFSDRYTFLSGEEQLLITGYKPGADLELIREFFKQGNFEFNRKLLKEKNISYIYIRKDEVDKPLSEGENGIKEVFANDEVLIFSTK